MIIVILNDNQRLRTSKIIDNHSKVEYKLSCHLGRFYIFWKWATTTEILAAWTGDEGVLVDGRCVSVFYRDSSLFCRILPLNTWCSKFFHYWKCFYFLTGSSWIPGTCWEHINTLLPKDSQGSWHEGVSHQGAGRSMKGDETAGAQQRQPSGSRMPI